MNTLKLTSLLILFITSLVLVSAQDSDAAVAITLERTACHGTCPVYTVAILEDGTVLYNGQDFVDIKGEQTSSIAPETLAQMLKAFEDIGYFDWNAAYDSQTVSDLATVTTSAMHDGEMHTITRYAGDHTAPLALPFLELWIDEMVNTALWTGRQTDLMSISNPTDTPLLTLQRGACFGLCPIYSIAAFDDGTLVYMGNANVDKIGISIFEAEASAVASIAQRAEIVGYFNWQDAYEERLITDQSTMITSIRWGDQFKRIVRYDGDPNAPVGLVRIENEIDQLVSALSK
jgi:hypothetical protein